MNITTTKPGNARHVSNYQILITGIFAKVYLLDQKTVIKVPRIRSEEDMQPIIRAAMIYNTIGVHPRIEECTSRGSDVVEFVDIKLYRHGDLAKYCQKKVLLLLNYSPNSSSRFWRLLLSTPLASFTQTWRYVNFSFTITSIFA